jgi:hypothetical protein
MAAFSHYEEKKMGSFAFTAGLREACTVKEMRRSDAIAVDGAAQQHSTLESPNEPG